MKITVCKGCGKTMVAINTKTGEPSCVVCIGISPDSGIPIEVDVPEKSTCVHCKKESLHIKDGKLVDLFMWDSKSNTYYCGCLGWD